MYSSKPVSAPQALNKQKQPINLALYPHNHTADAPLGLHVLVKTNSHIAKWLRAELTSPPLRAIRIFLKQGAPTRSDSFVIYRVPHARALPGLSLALRSTLGSIVLSRSPRLLVRLRAR